MRCAGRLHRPSTSDPAPPLVVMCHGVGGTAARLHGQASSFAEAGFAALTIDYRGWGDSGGAPRHVLDLAGQREDLRSAIASALSLEGVDTERIALWGVSLGGAHVVHLASEGAAVRGVIAQVPFNGFPRRVEGRSPLRTLRLLAAIARDRRHRRRGRAPSYIPIVGRPGELAVVTSTEAARHVESLSADEGRPSVIAPGGLLDMMRYRPSGIAHRVHAPLLVCVAAYDTETPPELAAQIAGRAPHGRLRSYPATHMDFYGDPELWSLVVGDQVAFLRECFAG